MINLLKIENILLKFNLLLKKEVIFLARIKSIRKMRNYIFFDVYNQGYEIQIVGKNGLNIICGDLVKITGVCKFNKLGQKCIYLSKILVINKWNSKTPFKNIKNIPKDPLLSFLPSTFRRVYIANTMRNNIRNFLTENGYFEVQTPILSRKFNGGKSFPVSSSYLNKMIGFNRTTMEDRMQALIGTGFEKIFQIGSIFRSTEEKTFLEIYSCFTSLKQGKILIKRLLKHIFKELNANNIGSTNECIKKVLTNKWLDVDFFDEAEKKLGIPKSLFLEPNKQLNRLLYSKKLITKLDTSPETIADKIASEISKIYNMPLIINGFPYWSSPLYLKYKKPDEYYKIQRSRIYISGKIGGFEIGIQENNSSAFMNRIKKQREYWGSDLEIGQGDLETVIAGGLPPTLGFAMSPDKILQIWDNNFGIDPFKK